MIEPRGYGDSEAHGVRPVRSARPCEFCELLHIRMLFAVAPHHRERFIWSLTKMNAGTGIRRMGEADTHRPNGRLQHARGRKIEDQIVGWLRGAYSGELRLGPLFLLIFAGNLAVAAFGWFLASLFIN
jgi:hypothetical protein